MNVVTRNFREVPPKNNFQGAPGNTHRDVHHASPRYFGVIDAGPGGKTRSIFACRPSKVRQSECLVSGLFIYCNFLEDEGSGCLTTVRVARPATFTSERQRSLLLFRYVLGDFGFYGNRG